jgi:hypothetical protein
MTKEKCFIKRIIISILFLIFVIAFILISYLNKKGVDCPFYHYFGYYCFLCGATRSTWALIDMQFQQAFLYNPMYFLMLPYLIIKYIQITYDYIKNNKFEFTKDMALLLICACTFMVSRNLNGFEFLIPSGNIYPIYTIYP